MIVSVVLSYSADFFGSHLLHCKYEVQNKTDFSQSVVQPFSIAFSPLDNSAWYREMLSCLGTEVEDS